MKSVGEVMGIGRTFKESLMKAYHSLEQKEPGMKAVSLETEKLSYPNSKRMWHLFQAFRDGLSISEIYKLTQITPWFLEQIAELVRLEMKLLGQKKNLLKQ